MDVDLRDLELLDAVRRHGTLTAAARHLFVSQPALSQRLTRLEDRVGVRLFERQDRQLVPTDAGLRLLQTAGTVLSELRSVRHDLEGFAADRATVVRIAAHCAPANVRLWLSVVLGRLRAPLEHIEIQFDEDNDDDSVAALDTGRIDIALIALLDLVPSFSRVRLMPLLDYELRAVLAASHPWARRPSIPVQDFAEAHLMLPEYYDRQRNPHVRLPIPDDVRPGRLTVVPGEPDALFDLLADAAAVTIVPTWLTGRIGARDLVSVQIGATPLFRTWYAATRPGRQSEAVAVVLAQLTELFAIGRGVDIDMAS